MTFFFVDPDIYNRYKEEILELSQSIQINYAEHLSPDKRAVVLSDVQIAEKLGLDVATVREIRCVGEREYYPIDEWQKALEFKDAACRSYARQGLSSATKKYVEIARAKAREKKEKTPESDD